MYTTLEYAVTALVCLITAIVIQRIYYKEKRTGNTAKDIKGIMWFGLAIFIWGFGALINLIVVAGFDGLPSHKFLIYLGVVISLLNSMFILLSLPSIEHQGKPSIVISLVERFSEREFAILFGGVMVMLAFVFIASSSFSDSINNSFIWLIDIPVSIVVAFALLNQLNRAFTNRQMRFMYLPSFALFVLIVIAVTHRIVPYNQVPETISFESWSLIGAVTALSFKFLFILLFSILLYSWKFLSEKEQRQSELDTTLEKKEALEKVVTQFRIANESHLDTINRLKEELSTIKEITKVELSDRQKEVLGNLGVWGNEKSYTDIAEAMHISVDGFQAHIHQIKKTLNVKGAEGKSQLIQYAKDHHLLSYASIKELK